MPLCTAFGSVALPVQNSCLQPCISMEYNTIILKKTSNGLLVVPSLNGLLSTNKQPIFHNFLNILEFSIWN